MNAARLFYSFLYMVIMFSCETPGKDTIYLIPQGFTGRATIYYDLSEGKPEGTEDNFCVLSINSDGCLLSRSKPNYGTFRQKFYYIDSSGKRTPIPLSVGPTSDSAAAIFHGITGEVVSKGNKIHFYSFIVCTGADYPGWINSDINKECLPK